MSNVSKERPLVTFALIAYNQEKFIREAVEGALAQTYEPLEIILSDDCSTDKTVDGIHAVLDDTSAGRTIKLNVNEVNLGLGAHINRVMEMAQGELIVVAAGDDVSLPGRVERMVNEWQKLGKRPDSIFSSAKQIDQSGVEQELLLRPLPPNIDDPAWLVEHWFLVLGSTHAWSRKSFELFGPLLDEIVFEDAAIAFRSALLGGIHTIKEPLVKYRRHEGLSFRKPNMSVADRLFDFGLTRQKRMVTLYRQRKRDLQVLNADSELIEIVDRELAKHKFLLLLAGKGALTLDELRSLKRFGVSKHWIVTNTLKYKLPTVYSLWLKARRKLVSRSP